MNHYLKKVLSFLSMSFAFSLLFSHLSVNVTSQQHASLKASQQIEYQSESPEKEEVFSYRTIFNQYYQEAKSNYPEHFAENCSLDQFISAYYKQNLPIDQFSASYQSASGIQATADFSNASSGPRRAATLEIISPDENYILGSGLNQSESTDISYFKRRPVYQSFSKSLLQKGDIVYESRSSSPTKHVAYIYDTSHSGYYGSYVQTIEAVAGGVQYGFLDDMRIIDFGVIVYRIYRATELLTVARASAFIVKQIGKPYSIDFTHTDTDENETEWYCSELVFAAYWAGGMNIASTNSATFDPETMPILPVMLTNGMLNYEVDFSSLFLSINIVSFENRIWNNSRWNIRVYNPNSFPVTISYNTKMCNEGDAKNWTNLSDLVSNKLSAGSSITVNITQNWFATSVAFSYIGNNNHRYITYASNLDKTKLTMTVLYNRI